MQQNNGLYVSCPACGDEESEAHGRLVLLRTLCISVLFTMPLMWSLRPLIQFLLATFSSGRECISTKALTGR